MNQMIGITTALAQSNTSFGFTADSFVDFQLIKITLEMTHLSRRPSLTGLIFLICYLVHHVFAVHHLRDDQVKLHIDGTSFSDIHDATKIDGATQHVFREFAAGVSSRTDLVKYDRVSPEHVHEVMFGIQQRNIDLLTVMLHDISDPDSGNYGQHMTREDIEEISSNPESRNLVVRYLEESGATVVSQSHHGEYVIAQAPISVWEELLNTEFFLFHHTQPKSDTVTSLVRAEKYSVPRDLHEHIAMIFNTIQMPLSIWGNPVVHGLSDNTNNIHSNVVTGFITPEKLKRYYEIIDNGQGSKRSTQAVFETIGAYVSPEDLTNFQTRFNLTIQPVSAYIGGHVNDEICTFMPQICGEPNLDVQYMIATSEHSPTTHWYTDKNSFADWLLEVANTANPPLVISISYGAGEDTVSSGEFDAFNFQAVKLGLMGITILVSSGGNISTIPAANNLAYMITIQLPSLS
jgi:Pro-kumamolisin, activation domain